MEKQKRTKKMILNIEEMNIAYGLSMSNAIFHLIYFIIFLTMEITPLLYFNLVGMIFCAIVALLTKKSPYFLLLIALELYIHVIYATLLLGQETGFILFFFSIIPISFFIIAIYKAKNSIFLSMVAISVITYFVIYFLNQYDIIGIRIELTQSQEIIIMIYNSIITFLSIVGSSIVYVTKIKHKEEGLKNKNLKLERLASVDPLTELLNRRSINQKLELSMQRKSNLNIDFTIAISDIDNFKELNDKYGHVCGDFVLKGISEEIRETVRDTDYVCRWGGEEILILFSSSGQEHAGRVLERIRDNIKKNGVEYNGEKIDVSMTFGVASSENLNSVKDIILKADENLYHGKKSGKNCIVYS